MRPKLTANTHCASSLQSYPGRIRATCCGTVLLPTEVADWTAELGAKAKLDEVEDDTEGDRWDELLKVENGDWSAMEIQERLQALSRLLQLDWREELDEVLSEAPFPARRTFNRDRSGRGVFSTVAS
jgi:hypothetical protein